MLLALLLARLLLGLVEERSVIREVGDYIFGEVVLDDCEVRNDGVNFLWGGLTGKDTEFMLLFT